MPLGFLEGSLVSFGTHHHGLYLLLLSMVRHLSSSELLAV